MRQIEETLDELEHGRIDRRTAVKRLAAMTGLALGGFGVSRAESTFATTGLDHLALRVTDVARSREFYREHLGLAVLRDEGEARCFMSAGDDHFVALFRGERAGMDHYCYTVPDYDATASVARLKSAGLSPRRRDDRVYFEDPDGLTVQLSGTHVPRPG